MEKQTVNQLPEGLHNINLIGQMKDKQDVQGIFNKAKTALEGARQSVQQAQANHQSDLALQRAVQQLHFLTVQIAKLQKAIPEMKA